MTGRPDDDFSKRAAGIDRSDDAMEAAAGAGRYPLLAVERPWSVHNPRLEGEFASPGATRLRRSSVAMLSAIP